MKSKKLIPLTLLFILTLAAGITACAKTNPGRKLEAPQNLKVERRIASWDEVENAAGYVVYVEKTEYETEECSFELSFLTAGTYRIEVMTLGDGKNYGDSEWANVTFTVKEAVAHGFDETGFEYTLLEDEESYEVSRGKADLRGEVIIPDYFGDYPVKRIAEHAFTSEGLKDFFAEANCNVVTTSIRLPSRLETIGNGALSYMVRLEEVVIPDTVTEIGGSAFAADTHLKRVVLPKGLKEIPDSCFSNTALSELTLPDMLEVIGDQAFWCHSLDLGSKVLHIDSDLSSVIIPDSVKSIGVAAFRGREKLASVTVSKNLERIERYVFKDTLWYESQPAGMIFLGDDFLYGYKDGAEENCTIEIPAVKIIAPYAFGSAKTIRKVIIPNGVKFIGEGMFANSSISEVVFPAGLTEISQDMFYSTENLKSIVIPEGVTTIGSMAFDRSGIEEIFIPQSVKTIGSYAFANCDALAEIVLPRGLESVGNYAFANCDALTEIMLPEDLGSIGDHAFELCSALETIVLPASLKTLGFSPFSRCDLLSGIYYEGSEEEWEALVAQNNKRDFLFPPFSDAVIYCYSEEAPVESGNYWHYVDGIPTPWPEESV